MGRAAGGGGVLRTASQDVSACVGHTHLPTRVCASSPAVRPPVSSLKRAQSAHQRAGGRVTCSVRGASLRLAAGVCGGFTCEATPSVLIPLPCSFVSWSPSRPLPWLTGGFLEFRLDLLIRIFSKLCRIDFLVTAPGEHHNLPVGTFSHSE